MGIFNYSKIYNHITHGNVSICYTSPAACRVKIQQPEKIYNSETFCSPIHTKKVLETEDNETMLKMWETQNRKMGMNKYCSKPLVLSITENSIIWLLSIITCLIHPVAHLPLKLKSVCETAEAQKKTHNILTCDKSLIKKNLCTNWFRLITFLLHQKQMLNKDHFWRSFVLSMLCTCLLFPSTENTMGLLVLSHPFIC